jgi:poly-gamma-glutamate capsule biosynthesis protein CapA/YwtB (metallophosphatase superfamily)
MTRASRRLLTVAAVAAFAALVLALGQAPSAPDTRANAGGRSAKPAVVTTAASDRDQPDGPSRPSPAPPRGPEARGVIVEPPPPPPPRSFTFVATGDVLLHTALWDQARADAAAAGRPGHDFGPMLSGIQPVVSEADLAICHMETPVAPPGGPFFGYPSFSVPPEIAPALAATGYDACTTASNHTYDRGADGVDRTLAALDAAGISHAGSARTPQEAGTTTLLDVNGVTVALLSYTYSFNGVPAPHGETWRSNPIDEGRILADAATARQRGAEVVIAALHWGDEYNHDPNAQQAELAPRLIRSPDIDLLLGHHAHVVQPIEAVDGEWVVYGMGNLVSNLGAKGPEKLEGLLVRFSFTEQPTGGWRTTRAEFAPVLTDDRGPIRVLDVGQALADPGTGPGLRARLQTARDRTTAIVGGRGAPAQGLRPIAP